MSNTLKIFLLKGLNPRTSKDEGLNWSKFLKWTNFENSLKVKG